MAVLSPAPPRAAAPRPHLRRRGTSWRTALVVLGLGAALLTVWQLWNGSRSEYYASIALSMSHSWPDFFFGALDPAGTVTLDKIPGSYWIPALFVKLFGFSTFAVVLPNALAAVAATLITAVTGRRLGGDATGWLAGAVVATTPILIAVSRSNQPESFFVLGLALTAWAAVRAMQRAQLRWLLLAGVFVAAAFQAYMLEAWAVWPALAAGYLCTRQSWRRRIGHVVCAGLTSAALSVLWIAIVWLIPAGSRPYLGSTLHDNPWEMVFGYNGLGRFGSATADSSVYNSFTPPFSGSPGVFRLFTAQLAGQIGWLIPAALLAVALLVILRSPAWQYALVGGWLITYLVMFSAVAGMHQFYTAALAVPMALSIGTAFGRARSLGVRWPQVLLLAVTAGTAIGIGIAYGGYSVPVATAQAVLALAAVALLVRTPSGRGRFATIGLISAGMLMAPAVWSAVAISHPSATNPVAGGVSDVSIGSGFTGPAFARAAGGAAAGSGRFGMPGGFAAGRFGAGGGQPAPAANGPRPAPNGGRFGGGITGGSDDAALLSYVRAHAGGAEYLVAVFGAQQAATLIVRSDGGSVLPIGGFSGDDPVPTPDAFTAMVGAGDVPYVLVSGRGGGFGGDPSTASTQILTWVQANCIQVTDANVNGLYACAAR
ncbi:glycosyltransferase family 39 protein [Microbacterium kribbense]|uniref:Glycosyltransferase family 39 protein n=1 Tax=Microbacterium kribbense TaxID=433645 RepID=A0ABP7GK15_9MICO